MLETVFSSAWCPPPQSSRRPLRPGAGTPPHHPAQLAGTATVAQQNSAFNSSCWGQNPGAVPKNSAQEVRSEGRQRDRNHEWEKVGVGEHRAQQHQNSKGWSPFHRQ